MGCHADVLAAVRGSFPEAGRYPFATAEEVSELVAKKHGVKRENVLLGSGSTQILRTCTHVFTTKTAGLVAAIPAYEECADYARLMGHPITGVKLGAGLKMDLDAMQQASKGAGLVFYCNPNNPVGTAITGSDTRAYLDTLMKASPSTTVLVDEAYFEYGTMPGYETMIPVAVNNPRVVVARTFSKCFGMAGLRIGYAIGHKDTIAKMAAWDGVGNISVMGLQGAKAALAVPDSWVKAEQQRNEAARNFTQKWFADRGYTHTDSQTNFMFIDVKRPARDFRAACLKEGVLIGRDFRRTRSRTSASPSARWRRCRRPSRSSRRRSRSRPGPPRLLMGQCPAHDRPLTARHAIHRVPFARRGEPGFSFVPGSGTRTGGDDGHRSQGVSRERGWVGGGGGTRP